MLDKNFVSVLINEALSQGGDFAEVFMDDAYSSTFVIGEKHIKEASSSIDKGVGIRVCKGGEIQSYAYTNKLDKESLLQTAKYAAKGIAQKKEVYCCGFIDKGIENISKIQKTQKNVLASEKTNLLREVSDLVLNANPNVVRADGRYLEVIQNVTIANSNGLWVSDNRERTRFLMSAQVQ